MFSVIWSPSASGDFAAIVMAHMNRLTEIDDAAEFIDDQLCSDPTTNGQHIAEGLWRITSSPLAAFYSIDGVEVTVTTVRWIG